MKSQTKGNSKSDVASPGPVTPKTKYRENIQVDHHLFKGEVASCLKADKFGPVKLKSIEHVHHFHSVNSNGMPQRHCHDVAGHRHEWTHTTDKEGNWIAECGPAIKKVTRQAKNGVPKTTYEPVKVFNEDTGQWVVDNHKHEMTYLGSDTVSKAKVQKIRESNAATIGQVGVQSFEEPKVPEGYTVESRDSKSVE